MGTLLKKLKSNVISSGNTTQYFHLNEKARQGDLISGYLYFSNESLFYIKQMERT